MCSVTAVRHGQHPHRRVLAIKLLVRPLARLQLSLGPGEHIPCGNESDPDLENKVGQGFNWSEAWWSPPPESNRRPHPYHGSADKRRAIRHICRSLGTA
jgi:hypothetical protein